MHRIQEMAALAVEQVAGGKNLTEALAALWTAAPDLKPQERGAIQDITFGVMRHWAELRLVLRQLVPKALSEPFIEHLLIVALFQLYYSRSAPYAIVNEVVHLAATLVHGRFKGLVNGVLRNALRRREALLRLTSENEEARFNHPVWWLQALRKYYPQDWLSIIEADNAHPPMTLRVNRRLTDVPSYLKRLADTGILAEALDAQAIQLTRPVPVRELPGFVEGWVSVQDWGAQQAALRLDLCAGQRVLDACSAPGGKTCHMLELADLDVTALDIDGNRLLRVRENLNRLGLHATVLEGDAACPGSWWDGQLFDRILADVPCSASGIVRRHPDIRWLRRPEDFQTLARQQDKMLDALWPLLASGGKMLYATCSIYPEENSQQLSAFLQRRADACCVGQEQLLPTECHDGFYYALLEKR